MRATSVHVSLLVMGLSLLFQSDLNSQTIRGRLIENVSKQPIPDVFVFVSNTSIGTTTDQDGLFELKIGSRSGTQLFFSHLNYTMVGVAVPPSSSSGLDTFLLEARAIQLEEAVVSSRVSPAIRKNRLRRFTEALLGTSAKRKVTITNPETILFEEHNGVLSATAQQPIEIQNSALGYEVSFYLDRFRLFSDDAMTYDGSAFFSEMSGSRRHQARFNKNRRKAFEASSRKFFADAIQGKYDDYRIGFSDKSPKDNSFSNFREVDSLALLSIDDAYVVSIEGYLTILDLLSSAKQTTKRTATTSLAFEQQTVSSGATSYLFSTSDKVQLSPDGRILNPAEIEEYGFWTTQRLGALLPNDYKPARQ